MNASAAAVEVAAVAGRERPAGHLGHVRLGLGRRQRTVGWLVGEDGADQLRAASGELEGDAAAVAVADDERAGPGLPLSRMRGEVGHVDGHVDGSAGPSQRDSAAAAAVDADDA